MWRCGGSRCRGRQCLSAVAAVEQVVHKTAWTQCTKPPSMLFSRVKPNWTLTHLVLKTKSVVPVTWYFRCQFQWVTNAYLWGYSWILFCDVHRLSTKKTINHQHFFMRRTQLDIDTYLSGWWHCTGHLTFLFPVSMESHLKAKMCVCVHACVCVYTYTYRASQKKLSFRIFW